MKSYLLRPSGIRGRLLALGVFAPICHLHAASGTWNVDAPGNWSDTTKWAGGTVASGATFTADFSTVNLTGDHAITVDAPYSIGTLTSQDLTTASNFWVFGGTGPLTLDNGGSQPVLNILNRAPQFTVSLAGTNGFSKTGAGLAILSGDNSALSGTMNLVNVASTNDAGVRLASNTAIGGITTINVNGTATSGQ
jgi:autotransporter-associated beta strand protein